MDKRTSTLSLFDYTDCRRNAAGVVSVMAILSTVHCGSLNQVAGGSSSETVIGRVVNTGGSPACSTLVTLSLKILTR